LLCIASGQRLAPLEPAQAATTLRPNQRSSDSSTYCPSEERSDAR
jgi:hypothetical protein